MECRKIIHIDMDAFYASVEQRDHEHLRNRPVAVGGSGARGVVAAASYEARRFGVHSAMPGSLALKKCPQLIFVRPRFEVYKAISQHIRAIFGEYTPLVEPLSLDEAFLDVTEPLKGPPSATLIAREIRNRIFRELNLTCSAGISYNKFLAKVASDINKPNGYFVIHPSQANHFMDNLPIEKFHGVGKVTAQKFRSMGILTGKELKEAGRDTILAHFGKSGAYFFDIAHGKDYRQVEPDRISKSIGTENTFESDLVHKEELDHELMIICEDLYGRLQKARRFGQTITLKVKYHDFTQITRSRTFMHPIMLESQILALSREMLHEHRESGRPIRLLGVTISQLEQPGPGRQLRLDLRF
ncbi:MAG: DNA polymerase IV [Bacteroidales bacterium]